MGSAAGSDDWNELAEILKDIKDEYPDDENMIVVPDSYTRYEIIVRAMDIGRRLN